jgi:tRNA dimethylallyltransferase
MAIAERFNGEIINCDSTAVYRGFDIGTSSTRTASRHSASPDRHRRSDRRVFFAAQFRAMRPNGDCGSACEREAADRGGQHRLLLPRVDPRAVSGPGKDAELRERLGAIARRRASRRCVVKRVDPDSGAHPTA